MPCVSLEIHEDKEYPGAYSVKIDGREISSHIHFLQLTIEFGKLPTLTVKSTTKGVNLNSMVMWDIPEPYKGWMEYKMQEKKETPGQGV